MTGGPARRYGWPMIERSEAKPVLVVSACLLGVRCNHRGDANPSAAVAALAATHRLIGVCPETAGGLATPRPAAERQPDGTVRTVDGADVTAAFARGAEATVALARGVGAAGAVLKARSPSCGPGQIYDGSFAKVRVAGDGVTAAALRAAGVALRSEEDLEPGRWPTSPPPAGR